MQLTIFDINFQEVHPSSPAELAGLRSFNDYIIGADSILHESEDLYTLIEAHEARPLKLYVYNTDEDSCREVSITPNSSWGGEGSLGCGIGYGYLHRIPIRGIPQSAPVTKPVAKIPNVPAPNLPVPQKAPVVTSEERKDDLPTTMGNLNLSSYPTQQPQPHPTVIGGSTTTGFAATTEHLFTSMPPRSGVETISAASGVVPAFSTMATTMASGALIEKSIPCLMYLLTTCRFIKF